MANKKTQKEIESKSPANVQSDQTVKEPLPPTVEKKGMSTGAKVGIGIGVCCCAFLLIIIILIVGIAFWQSRKAAESEKNIKKAEQIIDEELASWQTYHNSRYGFTIKVPTNFSKTESENGDGASFIQSSPSVSINVFAVLGQGQDIDTYLNSARAALFNSSGGASEIEVTDTGLDNMYAQKRIWEYKNPVDNNMVYEVITTGQKNDVFYNIAMMINKSDYDQYKTTYDQMQKSFKYQ